MSQKICKSEQTLFAEFESMLEATADQITKKIEAGVEFSHLFNSQSNRAIHNIVACKVEELREELNTFEKCPKCGKLRSTSEPWWDMPHYKTGCFGEAVCNECYNQIQEDQREAYMDYQREHQRLASYEGED